MGTILRYPYEIRDAKEYFDDIPNVKVAPDMQLCRFDDQHGNTSGRA